MDREKEPIIIDIPLLEEGKKEEKKRSYKAIPMIGAIILLIFSLVIHSAIAVRACEYLKSEGSELLLSFILPDYKKSEPMIPPLPEENELSSEDEGDGQYSFEIFTKDLSARGEYGLGLTNETSYSPDLYQLLGSDRPTPALNALNSKYGKDSPKVLIYHTHATEGYVDSHKTSFRTEDTDKNVVALGELICLVLKKAGIPAIHLTELFDSDDWSAAYDNSNERVRSILEKNPSIKYVFDVHRDCIGNDESGYIRTVTEMYGRECAQLMFVCGTDEGGSGHRNWRTNLSGALQLQSEIYSEHPTLMRPVNLRRASFYQDAAPVSLILECGTCANTLTESRRSAVAFAVFLANYIKGSSCGLDIEELLDTLCP